jgi:YcxB-like protein
VIRAYAPAGPMQVLAWAILSALAALALTGLGMVLFAPKIVLRRRARFRGPMTIDASEEGVTLTVGASARTIAWTEFVNVEADKRMCVLHHGSELVLVPRRAFRNAERERAFLDLVERFVCAAPAHARRDKRRFDSGKSTPSANQ